MSNTRYIWRVILVSVTVAAVFAGLGTRLAFLHLGSNQRLRERIQRTRKVEQEILVGRGRVLSRNGEPLAMDLAVKDVCADPGRIVKNGHVRFIASHLSRLLDLEPSRLVSRLNRPDRAFAYVKRYVRTEEADEVARLKMPGVFFHDTTQRNYPHGALMCHVVGFANLEGVGSAGVEQQLNSYLRGTPGLRVSEKDGHRHELYSRRSLEIPAQEGADVFLTLDLTVQYIVEQALDEAMHEHQAKGAWAVVQRVRTGEILAMASRPGYDPNQFRGSSGEERRNRAISYNYEPGSTFKVGVIAAALNEGLVKPEDVIDCESGYWVYGGRPLRDYHAYDQLSVADVLKKSSNIGAAKIALMLGEDRLEKYLRKFGVGRPTGIELPGEEGGILMPNRTWSKISITRIAMGHEVAVTALQMLNLVSAIANDGFLMRPYLVQRVVDAQGRTIYAAEPEVVSRPINAETSAEMRRLLARVTQKGGTGRRAALEEYTVAGKTGTAQKPGPGGYSDKANMASFVGFLPAEDPELSVIVVVDEPQPLHTGGVVSAPVFRKIAEQVIRYQNSCPEVSYALSY